MKPIEGGVKGRRWMVLYAFDVDQTLWLSGGPIELADLMELRNSGHLLGLCGNFAAVTLRMPFLLQVRQYVPADEYVMVGNIQGVSGESDDHGAASRAGWRSSARRRSASEPDDAAEADAPFEAKAQAARRLRLTPEALDERERLLVTEGDFLRFGRNSTGAAGGDCTGATGDESTCSIDGAGGAATRPGGSRRLSTRPRPKASLNIAPYQSTTASAACIHGCGAGNGLAKASGDGVLSAGWFPCSSRNDSRCCFDLMPSPPGDALAVYPRSVIS